MRRWLAIALMGAGALGAATFVVPKLLDAQQQGFHVVVVRDVIHVISPRLDHLKPIPPAKGLRRELPLRHPLPLHSNVQPATLDPVLQSALAPLAATAPWINFLGDGLTQPNFSICCAPPDTNGAAGATQFVQWVNLEFGIFSKATGQIVYGPAEGNTLWQPLGGACASNNSGDPIAQYDKQAQRWVLMQPVFTSPYYLCVAVSTTPDAAGAYTLYQFPIPGNYFPDYPKLGVWPDGYYVSFNDFQGNNFVGGSACALNRSSMLAGASATMQCFLLTSYPSLLPSDLDGDSGASGTTLAPPAGSPDYYMDFTSTNSLNLFRFHVDWTNSANSTFTGPTTIPVAAFSEACGGGTCIPQPGTSEQLDSLGDRLMYRLAYRNFGAYESMVVSQSVNTGSGNTGVRWYEIRNPGTSPSLFQEGTYAPDSNYRWMPSIAEDKLGDIALGYSVSSTGTYPSIRYTGRAPSDPLGTMDGEAGLIAGSGAQQLNLSRWGDYSSMSVDPANDCTFWYTNEMLSVSGTFNWDTQIGSFSFPGCAAGPSPDFALTGAPASQTVSAGSSTAYFIGVNPVGSYTGSLALSVSAPSSLPAGMTVSLLPSTVDIPGPGSVNSYLAVSTTSATPAGTYTLTVSGTDGTNTNTASVTIVVQAPDFSLSISPTSQTLSGLYVDYTINVTPADGYRGNVTLSLPTSLPSGVNASFYSNPVAITSSSPGTSTLELSFTASAPAGTYNLSLSGTDGTLTHSIPFTLVIPSPGFTLTSLGSQSVAAGNSVTFTFYLNTTDYYSGSVNVSLTSPNPLPGGMTASFLPNTVNVQPTLENYSILTLNTTISTPPGTYNLTVTGSDGTNSQTATGTITVQPAPPPNFMVSSQIGSAGLVAGNNLTSTITVSPTYGYTGTITLSVPSPSPLPAGMTVGFLSNPVSITGTGAVTSTLTISTTTSTPPGNYLLTISGTDGKLTNTASIDIGVVSSPNFSLSSSPLSQSVAQGNSAGYTISVTPSGGFSGSVALAATGLPSGATASFNPSPVAVSSTAVTSALTIFTSGTTPTGTYTIDVTGTSGTLSNSVLITLTVQPVASSDFTVSASPSISAAAPGSSTSYTITIAGSSGPPFNGTVSLSVTGVPPRTSTTWSTTSIPGSGTAVLSVGPNRKATKGTYTLTITGTSGSLTHSVQVTFVIGTLSTPDFSVYASPTSQTVNPGSGTSYAVSVTPTNGFTGNVSLSVGGVPGGVTANFSSDPVDITSSSSVGSTLSITTISGAAPGTYTLTIGATSGASSHNTQATLVIQNPSGGGDFSISISPSSQTVGTKSSTAYTVTISALNGFTGTVSLGVSGLPTHGNGSFSASTISESGTSTLTISTLPKTPLGAFTITVTGTSGSLVHTASATLNVT